MEQENNDLQVIIKAKKLVIDTVRTTSNGDKFPKKYRFTLCDKMQNKAMFIYETLLEANRTHLNYKNERYNLQSKAIVNCDELLFYIEMCLELQIITSGCAEQWSKLVSDIKHMAIAWRTKDKNRQSA